MCSSEIDSNISYLEKLQLLLHKWLIYETDNVCISSQEDLFLICDYYLFVQKMLDVLYRLNNISYLFSFNKHA